MTDTKQEVAKLTELLVAAMEEAFRARRKFPHPNPTGMALAREAGEVVRAVLMCREGRATHADLLKEIVQTMAMCIRLATEGDGVMGVAAPLPMDSTDEPPRLRLVADDEVSLGVVTRTANFIPRLSGTRCIACKGDVPKGRRVCDACMLSRPQKEIRALLAADLQREEEEEKARKDGGA